MNILQISYSELLQNYNIPNWFIFLSWQLICFVFIAVLMIFTVLFLVLFERKILAFFTRRKGPNRVGINGCLQTVADGLKILFKENILPKKADKTSFFLAPILVFAPIMTVYCLIPFSENIIPCSSVIGLLLFISILSIPIAGILFAGYSSGNKFSIIGGIRSCIQAISSEIPIFIILAGIVILSNSMDLNEIVKIQNNFFHWNVFPSILGFIIFFICSLIILNRTPFDFPEAESELVAGYNSEYSGMKFAMFFLGEYALTFIFSAYTATLFLGGYNSPFGLYIANIFDLPLIVNSILINIEQFFWLASKTLILIIIIMWIRATYPRYKTDKMLELCWLVFIPLSIFNLIIVSIVQYLRGI